MSESSWIDEQQQHDMESCCSDAGSITAGQTVTKKSDEVSSNEMLKLNEEGDEFVLLKHQFYLSIGPFLNSCKVIDAHRNLHCSPMKRAHLEAFRIFMNAMAAKHGGNPNIVNAWYWASKEEVHRIMKDGFHVGGMSKEFGLYGHGLHLCSEFSTCDSLLSAPVDADGLRHLVICRVILGSAETILPGSTQSAPSARNFDSGVDKQQSPSKYIVWYPDIKTNILPLYALSVKFDFPPRVWPSAMSGFRRQPAKKPTSPWMPFNCMVYALAKFVPRSTMCMIKRLHTDFLERKINRLQFITGIRRLTGDKALIAAIGDYQEKRMKGKSKIPTK